MIERLRVPPDSADVDALADLLADTVAGGAGVSFMPPFSVDDARRWWLRTVQEADRRAIILVARDEGGIAGTVQLDPAWAPNQPHRADVTKLMVDRRARGSGLGRELMRALDTEARAAGFTLLTLDTCEGSAAERLYLSEGWQRVGVIPKYALNPDGSDCDTVIFYKQL